MVLESQANRPEGPRAFQFSISAFIVAVSAMSLLFAFSRMFASVAGVSVSTFIAGMGFSFLPLGFALVIFGAVVLAIKPNAKWAGVSVNVGGIMMAALLPAVFIGTVLSGIVASLLR